MPLQVVQAKATIPKPSFSISSRRSASCRYFSTTLEPGAKEDLTQGLRTRPSSLALRATKPAAMTLRGLLVLVQLVIAAIMTAPSGMLSSSFSTVPAIPRAASSEVGTRRWGLEGPAILRPTVERSKLNTRSYSAFCKLSAQRPVSLA